jgi:hypothetical protein
MNQPDSIQPDVLLEFHLGLLDAAAAQRVRRELERSPELAIQAHNLKQWLDLVGTYRTPAAPAALPDRIMQAVNRTAPLRVTEAASSLPPSPAGGLVRRPLVSLRELVALAACLMLFIGVVVPGVAHNRSQARQTQCANSLASIFGGLSQYAANFNGAMPQTAGFAPGVNWLRPSTPQAAYVPNSRNRYMLVRLQFVKPDGFVCAAMNGARPMTASGFERLEDFPAPENCSFDSQNMAGPTLPLGERNNLPIYADRNPLFDGGKLNVANPAETNSRTHNGGTGQNVLCTDGRVLWTTSPVLGPRGDNIWQVEGVTSYNGTEYQQHPADAFVIP